MNAHVTGETIRIDGLQQLNGPEAALFREQILSRVKGRQQVDVDLSQTMAVDGGGLSALLALHKACGSVRLLNPPPQVRQILELTRMNRVFQIVQN